VGRTKKSDSQKSIPPIRPALSPEARELQMTSLAMDLAEQQLRDGTASSQVITHFLKRDLERERLEKEKLHQENEVLRAKAEALQSQKRSEELFSEAIAAFRRYSGQSIPEEDDYYED
jgi:hypothetical protein